MWNKVPFYSLPYSELMRWILISCPFELFATSIFLDQLPLLKSNESLKNKQIVNAFWQSLYFIFKIFIKNVDVWRLSYFPLTWVFVRRSPSCLHSRWWERHGGSLELFSWTAAACGSSGWPSPQSQLWKNDTSEAAKYSSNNIILWARIM